MKPDKLLWTWVIVGALFIIAGVMQYLAFSHLSSTIGQLDQKIDETTGSLSAEIASIDQTLQENTAALSAALETTSAALQTDIDQTEASLQRQIGNVQRTSQEGLAALQEQVGELNIKTQDFSLIVEDTLESVVSVFTDLGIGSGAIVHEDGYVVTNYHVIRGASQAGARASSGTIYAIRLVAWDEDADLALLKLNSQKTFRTLGYEPARDVKVGTKVIALGSPLGLEFTVTEGIISATDRENENGVPVFQTDVPINPGNSGGPIVNIKGNLVGISTYKAGGYESLGFAVQSDTVRSFANKAIQEDLEN